MKEYHHIKLNFIYTSDTPDTSDKYLKSKGKEIESLRLNPDITRTGGANGIEKLSGIGRQTDSCWGGGECLYNGFAPVKVCWGN